MNKDEAIKIVESRQKWAKGDDSQPQPNMIEVYEAIDLLLAEAKNNSRLVNVSESAGYIEDYDSNFIYCLLKKEQTMNKELKYPIYALNEEQKKIVSKGRMIEFNHETGAIIFNV